MSYIGTYKIAYMMLPGENGMEKISIEQYLSKEKDARERARMEKDLVKKIIISQDYVVKPCMASLEGIPQSEIDKILKIDPNFYIEGDALFSKADEKNCKEENGELLMENNKPNFLFGKEPWVKLSTGTPGEIKYAMYYYQKEN